MKELELKKVLDLHKKWVNNDEKGKRADLRRVNLQYANLQYANLQYANLQDADLRRANLQRADLGYADLGYADLGYADLRGANLQDADLRGANLQKANLRGADLRGANIDFSCLPLWCGGFDFKIDEKQAKQLMYHVINLMQYSELDTTKIVKKHIYKWLSDSHLVIKNKLPILEGIK